MGEGNGPSDRPNEAERVGDDATWIAAPDDPSNPSQHSAIGKVVAGRYKLRGVLGHGGMGTVFEAQHVELGKRVAIKVLSENFNGHPQATARFLREARAASAIESEHIAQVFDVGHDPLVGLYMILELLKGEDLARVIRSRERLKPNEAAGITWQVCLALERAHDAGIVHRDLKPANVFLTRVDDGSVKVKVLDFGIAKLVSDAQQSSSSGAPKSQRAEITQSGLAVGTPQYMSPEQALAQAVDQRTDLYSLGAVLFEMVAGRAPYPDLESEQETMLKILREPPPRLSAVVPDVPPLLDKLVDDLMARDVDDRPKSALDVRARLKAIDPTLGRSTLLIGAHKSIVPPPADAAAPPRTASALTVEKPGDRDATTVTAMARKQQRPVVPLVVGAVVVAIGAAFALRLRATSVSSPAPAEAPPAPVAASLEDTIDPTELIRAAERALARGDAARAKELATKATQRTPDRTEAWLALGAACDAAGDAAGARAAYESCAKSAKDARAPECTKHLAR